MQKRSIVLGLWLLFAAVLAACTSGGGFNPSPCPLVATVPPQLLYPVPGSTGVPDNVGVVIYAGNSGVATISLFNGGMAAIPTSPTALPSPLPTPIATPSNASVPLYAVSFGTLAPNTLYQVRYASSTCGGTQNTSFGFFTSL